MELPGYAALVRRYGAKYLAVYHSLRTSIRSGRLVDGERLPPSRELAARYGISRGTVNIAYEMLLAEGYVKTRVGSGTVVSFPDGGRARPRSETVRPDLSRRAVNDVAYVEYTLARH